MGRQTGIHMLPGDVDMFLAFAREHDPVVVTLRDSQVPEIEPVVDPCNETSTMILWNTPLLPSLQRRLIERAVGGNYFRVDDWLPTLELSPSCAITWNGKAGLLQGRIYGFAFDRNGPEYARWYSALARWLRAHFVKNPVLSGYVGPAAFEWFRQGGILLPML